MVKKIGDLLGIGLLLVGIYIFLNIWTFGLPQTFINLLGLIGSVIVIIVESFFLYQKWIRR